MSSYDCIVLGVGGAGSAALHHLRKRGANVVGVDRFPPGHARGSSHGRTRMFRLAYFEHPDYVPLLRRAYELWEELDPGLYNETGVLQIGPPDGEVISGVRRAAAEHGLAIEDVDAMPGLAWPDSMCAVFERRAGLLSVEECVKAHARGAELRIGEAVVGWRAEGDGVVVDTETETLRAARLVITPGAWAPEMLADLGVPFSILRKSLFWYGGTDALPGFYFELPDGHFYGFPAVDGIGMKFAEHTGGTEIDDPLAADREVVAEEKSRVEAFLEAHVPAASRRLVFHEACFYTVTPDQHFIVDRHPRHPQVAIAAGLSGHGFKFASVLGEILADLALDGTTRHPIGFLGLGRFG